MNQLHEVYMDITRMEVDAIICAVNESGLKSTGLTLPDITTPGQVQVTPGAPLPCRLVIHTCVPIWEEGNPGQEAMLAQCCRASLEKARASGCKYVALPILGSDMGGFPMALALQIAKREIRAFLAACPGMDIYLAIPEAQSASYTRTVSTHQCIQTYITQRMQAFAPPVSAEEWDMASMPLPDPAEDRDAGSMPFSLPLEDRDVASMPPSPPQPPSPSPVCRRSAPSIPRQTTLPLEKFPAPKPKARRPSFLGSLMDLLTSRNLPVREEYDWGTALDESFSDMLIRLIDQKGMTDAQCYNKAGVDRRVFSRIRSGKDSSGRPYQPSKPTVLAFAIALELPLDTASELLQKAGYALSPCYKFDIIVEYFIRNRIYDLYEVNLALYEFDQPLLGSKTVS